MSYTLFTRILDGNGRGPCAGDTGGPLMIRSSRDSNRQVLAGIASWSTSKISKFTMCFLKKITEIFVYLMFNVCSKSYL